MKKLKNTGSAQLWKICENWPEPEARPRRCCTDTLRSQQVPASAPSLQNLNQHFKKNEMYTTFFNSKILFIFQTKKCMITRGTFLSEIMTFNLAFTRKEISNVFSNQGSFTKFSKSRKFFQHFQIKEVFSKFPKSKKFS